MNPFQAPAAFITKQMISILDHTEHKSREKWTIFYFNTPKALQTYNADIVIN